MPLTTETMVLNMGPHHPSTHGVLRFILRTDGEVIHICRPDIGYLHGGLEKIAEQVPYAHFMPYTDRLDYLAAMNCNLGFAITVERGTGLGLVISQKIAHEHGGTVQVKSEPNEGSCFTILLPKEI